MVPPSLCSGLILLARGVGGMPISASSRTQSRRPVCGAVPHTAVLPAESLCIAQRRFAILEAELPIATSCPETCAPTSGDHVPQHEPRIARMTAGNVPQLHPTFGAPTHELDVFGGEMFAPHDRGCAVVFLEPIVDDQLSSLEVLRHRRARIRCWMLYVGPVHVSTGKRQILLNRLAGIVWDCPR